MQRWYQFSLGAMCRLTAITAAFFAGAAVFGYVDATITLLAAIVLVGVLRYPRPAHRVTAVVVVLLAGTLLWANLRATRWEEEFCQTAPQAWDPLTRGLFWRGWPLCPWMFCHWRHMALATDTGLPSAALLCDGAVFVIALRAAKAGGEWCWRRCQSGAPRKGSGS